MVRITKRKCFRIRSKDGDALCATDDESAEIIVVQTQFQVGTGGDHDLSDAMPYALLDSNWKQCLVKFLSSVPFQVTQIWKKRLTPRQHQCSANFSCV